MVYWGTIKISKELIMGWEYSQSTGRMTHNGAFVEKGYSGGGEGKDNPDMERAIKAGPIPRGTYHIGSPRNSSHSGPYVLDLTPYAHNAHGRTEFLIHGDSISNPGNASEGCIVLSRKTREKISATGDNVLEVVR
jgi:hypothetical protein